MLIEKSNKSYRGKEEREGWGGAEQLTMTSISKINYYFEE